MIAEIRQRLRIERLTTQDWPEADRHEQQRHDGEERRVAQARPHASTRPRKIPVGRTSSTTTRMRKEIASL